MSLKRQIEAAAKNAYLTIGARSIPLQQLNEISDPIKVKFSLNAVSYEATFYESELQEVQWEMPGVQGKIKFKR